MNQCQVLPWLLNKLDIFPTLAKMGKDKGASMKKLLLIFTLLLWIPTANANEAEYHKGVLAHAAKDYKTAFKIWKSLAESGHTNSQYYLGKLYAEGEGTIQNYAKAARWYRRAAKLGHAESQYEIGYSHEKGLGATQDYKKAMEWYQKSAKQGYVTAQSALAIMYFGGLEHNLVSAYVWANIAKINNEIEDSQKNYQNILDLIQKHMSSADIEKAKAISQNCWDSEYKNCEVE